MNNNVLGGDDGEDYDNILGGTESLEMEYSEYIPESLQLLGHKLYQLDTDTRSSFFSFRRYGGDFESTIRCIRWLDSNAID